MAYLKTRPGWIQLLLFIGLALIIFTLLSVVGLFILSNMTGISILKISEINEWDYADERTILLMRGLLIIQFIGLFLVPSIIFASLSDPRPLEYLGFKKPSKLFYLFAGIIIMIVSIPFIEWLGLLNRDMKLSSGLKEWMSEKEDAASQQIKYMLSRKSVSDLFFNVLFIAGLAAVGEELFFRGVVQRLFIRIFKNAWAGIILTAIIFSAIHFQFYGFLPRFILGVLLGALYWYSGSLWTPILAHFFYNGIIIVIAYFNPELVLEEETHLFNASKIILPAMVSLVAVIAILWYMRKKSETSFSRVYSADFQPVKDNPF